MIQYPTHLIEAAMICALSAINLFLLAWNITLRARIKVLRREFKTALAWNWRQIKQWRNN